MQKQKDICPTCKNDLPRWNCIARNGKSFTVPYKYCPDCNPYDPIRERAQFENRARTLANQYPERINIIYECPCDDPNKKKHHFNYSYPYDVFLICQRCHMEEHKKINRLRKFYGLDFPEWAYFEPSTPLTATALSN